MPDRPESRRPKGRCADSPSPESHMSSRRECPLGCNIMRENHESIIGNAGHGVESFHSRDALLNVRGLLTKRINSVVAEFPVGMVVAMDADGEPLWVRMK